MKYFLIVGEASGDLHAAHLMAALLRQDPAAQFRYYGGDKMRAVAEGCAQHYKDIAYMGFLPVVRHLPTILRARKNCKKEIARWQPDTVILVDYAGFNLNIARHLSQGKDGARRPRVYYYIPPKIWAWKEYRVKELRRYVDEIFCILPFEKDYYAAQHNMTVHYVGSPTAEEVAAFRANYHESASSFRQRHHLDDRPIIALLAGSRRQEVKDSLPIMRQVAQQFPDYQFVVAAVSTLGRERYARQLRESEIQTVWDETYQLLIHSTAAIVTSGTATLETALFAVPQVVIYKTILPHIVRRVWDHCFRVKYISLVNLIANKAVVEELFAEKFTLDNLAAALRVLLPGGTQREQMLDNYAALTQKLGDSTTPAAAATAAATTMLSLLRP